MLMRAPLREGAVAMRFAVILAVLARPIRESAVFWLD
jgi:hypothetical protein